MDLKLGSKIRKIRKFKGLTQEDVALKLNISQKAFSKIENDETKIDLERLQQISDALGIDPIDLLALDEKQVFNNCTQLQTGNVESTINNASSDVEKDLYERQIKELKEEIIFLRSQVENLIKQ